MSLSKAEKLLAVSFDTQTASRLAAHGWTVAKLRRAKAAELDALGVPAEARKALKRPAIPADVLFQVLFKSKRTCCVCRTVGLPIIVHHISEWHTSRDHSEENLAVLCLNDHGNAHTSRELSQNLTAAMIQKHKEEWEQQVRESDTRALIGLSRVEGANWDYVNLNRVFRLARQLKIEVRRLPHFDELRAQKLVTPIGDLEARVYSPVKPKSSMYLFGLWGGQTLYEYATGTLEAVVGTLGVVDISDARSYSELRALAADGTLVFVQAPFYFSRDSKVKAGAGQNRIGYTKIGGVRIQFAFDAWESTSLSANIDRLSGHKVESVIGLVSGSDYNSDPPTLQLSCLGIGSWFQQIHVRATPRIAFNRELHDDDLDLDATKGATPEEQA